MPTDLTSYPFTMEAFRADVLRHLTFTLGKDADHARTYDWRMALSKAGIGSVAAKRLPLM